jgi:hypothetical protein
MIGVEAAGSGGNGFTASSSRHTLPAAGARPLAQMVRLTLGRSWGCPQAQLGVLRFWIGTMTCARAPPRVLLHVASSAGRD